MIIPQNWDYNYDENISNDEYQVINKFLSSYRKQNVIVADNYRQDSILVPLEEKNIVFNAEEDEYKSIDFCRKIYHKGKPYIVNLSLWRVFHTEDSPKCLTIEEFNIVTNGKVHFIDLNTKDATKSDLLFNIINIFDEKKIISPEQAYCKRMYTDKVLQKFISNHEWQKIYEGIKQMPELANALFIIKEGYKDYSNFVADFGTILYQLISYRQNNLENFDEKDLLELDKLILNLRKTDLLKVQLHEDISNTKSLITTSILLEADDNNCRLHESQQYNVINTELSEENKTLNKCIKKFKYTH